MPAETMADPLRSTDLTEVELLVRETLQNSIDEKCNPEEPLTVVFRAKNLVAEKKTRFIEKLCFDEIADRLHLFPEANNWYRKGKIVLEEMHDAQKPLRVLEISDHSANSLSGRWNIGQSINDRFFNLVLSLAKTKKQEESTGNLLASYGFGKMVFALSSNLRTMIYYSHFPKSERSGDDERRLMASSFLPSYYKEDEQLEYTGHAYFGVDSDKDNNPKMPLVNSEADKFFEDLGFEPRETGDFGSSILLPGFDLRMEDLKAAIEKWWWPLLTNPSLDGMVRLRLIEDDGHELEISPRNREDIYPFIQAANNNRENFSADRKANTQDLTIVHDGQRKSPGRLSCVKLPASAENDLQNRMAIIRDNPVIDYKERFFMEEATEAVAVFVVTANSDLKRMVTFSEPPAHDRLFESHSRLIEIYSTSGSDFIRLMLGQIQEKCRDFQTSLAQVSRPKNSDALAFLDDMLGSLIKPRKPGTPTPPPPSTRIQTIQKSAKTSVIDGITYSELTLELGLIEEAE